jgi:hypothetical protein
VGQNRSNLCLFAVSAIWAIALPDMSGDSAKPSAPGLFYQLSMIGQQFSTQFTSQIPLSHMLSNSQLRIPKLGIKMEELPSSFTHCLSERSPIGLMDTSRTNLKICGTILAIQSCRQNLSKKIVMPLVLGGDSS